MKEYTLFNSEGKFPFGVSISGGSSCGDDLGTGTGTSITIFETEEGRRYWIQCDKVCEKLCQAISIQESLARRIERMSTVKGAWQNLRTAIRKATGK